MPERRRLAGRRGAALMVLSVLAAYALRFASSWWLLGHGLGPRFDPHAFGTLGDAVLLSVAAPPLAGLLWWVMRRRGAWRGLFAPASGPGWTLLSILLLLGIGAPTPNQVWAMLLLPAAEAWPAMVSAACWFVTVALLRAAAVTGTKAIHHVRRHPDDDPAPLDPLPSRPGRPGGCGRTPTPGAPRSPP